MIEVILWFMAGCFVITAWKYVSLRIRYAKLSVDNDSIYENVYSGGLKYRTMPKFVSMPGGLFFDGFPDGNIVIHYMQMAQSPKYRDMFDGNDRAQRLLEAREVANRQKRKEENENSS